MSKKESKTNAMRILDRMKISYTYETYECDEFTDGIQVADKLNLDHRQVFKTLVTTGKTGNHYVFVIPIEPKCENGCRPLRGRFSTKEGRSINLWPPILWGDFPGW